VQPYFHNIPEIEQHLGYHFKDPTLLARAFVHRSFLNENKSFPCQDNERLEFLGDSVLNLIVSEYLFCNLPQMTEGELSSLRAHVVSSHSCIAFIEKLHLAEFILVSKGEKMQAGRGRSTILADVFEAILGAIYLDAGFEETRRFFFSHFEDMITDMCLRPKENWKALLQNLVQKTMHLIPHYFVLEESGPDHNRQFLIGVFVGDRKLGTGSGKTKKEAEQEAAKIALEQLSSEAV
jgi:ribonuclease III